MLKRWIFIQGFSELREGPTLYESNLALINITVGDSL